MCVEVQSLAPLAGPLEKPNRLRKKNVRRAGACPYLPVDVIEDRVKTGEASHRVWPKPPAFVPEFARAAADLERWSAARSSAERITGDSSLPVS